MTIPKKILPPALLLLLLVLTFVLYLPGLRGDFIFDDFINIVDNSEAHLSVLTPAELGKVLASGVASEIKRPLSMLTFGLNHYFTGLDPYYFKLTNVLIHLLISVGLYLLGRELLVIGGHAGSQHSQRLLALFIAACWALHPLNVSAVLYVVQRMNQLAVLVEVFTLLFYCRFRQRQNASQTQALIAMALLGALAGIGVLFKENGVLVVLFILVVEIFLLKFKADSAGQRRFLQLFISVMVVLPAIGAIALLLFSPSSLIGNYSVRDFTLIERLLTETRALWHYIGWLIMPDTRAFHFYHDDFVVSRSLVDPLSTLFAAAGIAGLLIFSWAFRKRLPFLCFGIAFFFAGHALESTFVSLELVFEHRNYLPGYGLLFGMIYTLLNFPGRIIGKQAAGAFLAIFLVFLSHGTFLESRKWSNTYDHLRSIVRESPDSHRGNYALGFYYLTAASAVEDNSLILDAASFYYRRAAELDKTALRGFTGVILADGQNDKPIDPAIVDELEQRLRTLPLGSNALTEISMLTECLYGGFCRFDKSVLVRLYTAIANNEASDPLVGQAILDQLGSALYEVFNAKEDGKALLYLAREKSEDLTIIDVKLARMEMEMGNSVQARQVIAQGLARTGTIELKNQLQALHDRLDQAQ